MKKTYNFGVVSSFYSTCLTNDSSYISACQNIRGIYIVKVNSLENTIWTRTYSGSYASSIKQTDENGYIVVGTKNFTTSRNDVYLSKIIKFNHN